MSDAAEESPVGTPRSTASDDESSIASSQPSPTNSVENNLAGPDASLEAKAAVGSIVHLLQTTFKEVSEVWGGRGKEERRGGVGWGG